MQDRLSPNHDEVLERATKALSRTPLPEGPSAEIVARVVSALEELEKAASRPLILKLKERVFAMKPMTKIAVAAAVLAACWSLFAWLAPEGGTALALDRVAEALANLPSATWKIEVSVEGQGKLGGAGKAMFLPPSRERVETSLDFVAIHDIKNGKSLNLLPKKKEAILYTAANLPAQKGPASSLERLRGQVRDAQRGAADVERLGQREIDGRHAAGFRIQSGYTETEIWADPQTALPVRAQLKISMPGGQPFTIVMSDFRFDVPLDKSLFSLQPPEGYTLVEQEIDVSESQRARDLAELLGYFARHNDGVFPDSLTSDESFKPIQARLLQKLQAKHGEDSPEVEKGFLEFGGNAARTMTTLVGLGLQSKWHYAGKGVKLGTADRPILWYKPAESEDYRVIYADLSVKDVAPADLPKVPEDEPVAPQSPPRSSPRRRGSSR